MNVVYYLPLFTFTLSLIFAANLFLHLREKKNDKTYLRWWLIGLLTYGAGTLCESINTLTGWHDFNFRCWYITGAWLGGAPLAQGTVYLLLKKRVADVLTVIFVTSVVLASIAVFLSPVDYTKVNPEKMSADVFEWHWIRAFTPFINIYALIFLAGGAIYSAIKYFRKQGAIARFRGNVLIALGAILPGIGGTSTRFGHVEVLYVTELLGLILIFIAYRIMRGDRTSSVHVIQQEAHG